LREQTNFSGQVSALPPSITVHIISFDNLYAVTLLERDLIVVFRQEIVKRINVVWHGNAFDWADSRKSIRLLGLYAFGL
jgi:hypothetical protein